MGDARIRVLIDARPALDARGTGITHYTRQIVRYLAPADPNGDYVAWYLHARGLFKPRTFFPDVPRLTEAASRFPARVFQPVSWRLQIPRVEWLVEGRFDFLLAPNYLPPPTSSRGVVPVVHDLAFEVLPDTAPHHDARWRRRFAEQLRRSARVIVPSVSTRDDLVQMHGVDADRVDVIHHGTDAAAFAPPPQARIDEALSRLGIEGPYLLFVGGIEPRKNLEALVHGFGQVGTEAKLVIAGGPVRWVPEADRALDETIASLAPSARDRVVRVGFVSERDKRALLAGATLFVYPSLYEGFGFPVLEAFAAGTPVLTSDASSLPEVAGDAAVLVDPRDPAAIAAGLKELLEDEDLRNLLRAKGAARVTGFTWEKCARETAAALHRASELV